MNSSLSLSQLLSLWSLCSCYCTGRGAVVQRWTGISWGALMLFPWLHQIGILVTRHVPQWDEGRRRGGSGVNPATYCNLGVKNECALRWLPSTCSEQVNCTYSITFWSLYHINLPKNAQSPLLLFYSSFYFHFYVFQPADKWLCGQKGFWLWHQNQQDRIKINELVLTSSANYTSQSVVCAERLSSNSGDF